MSELLRVESARIKRWGPLSGFELPFADNDFVLLFGANESGKTSFATALAWLLAGPGPQQLLRRFGEEDKELEASLTGSCGAERLSISAAARVPKAGASGQAGHKRFSAAVGDKELTLSDLTDRLKVGEFDSYRSFYWVESFEVADGPDLTDRLSAKAVFGGIDPYKQRSKLKAVAETALGMESGPQPRAGSARAMCEEVDALDKRFETIAGARAAWDGTNGILREKRLRHDSIKGQLRSLRLAQAAFCDGHVDNVKCWTSRLEQLPSPSRVERKLYDERESVGESIGNLKAAEASCQSLSDAAEKPSDRLPSGRRPVQARIAVGFAALLAVVLASFVDRRLSGLLVAGACVAAAMLLQRHRNAEEHRQEQLETVRRRFAGTEHIRLSPTVRGDGPAPSGAEVPASTLSARNDVPAPPEINDADDARGALQAIKDIVDGYDEAVRGEREARIRRRKALDDDGAALDHVAEDDPDSLRQQILVLEDGLDELAEGAPSVDDKIEELEQNAEDLRRSSNEAAANRLQRGQLITEIRAQMVQGLGHGFAAELLLNTAESYQTERQPELLRRSRLWASNVADWTDLHIVLPFPDDKKQAKRQPGIEDRLRVVGPHGDHPARRQSFGARSLLYLMLRLATVVEQGEATGVRLPVILDDVLVGLDDDRAERCIGVLRDFSEQHQTILLTCHRNTVERAEAAGAAVLTMP